MSERQNRWLRGGVIFLLLMARTCACAVRYWPQLDDYIQYHNYAAAFTFSQLQETVGLLASRPLAGLADYFVWSPLFDRMIVAAAILSALYALSALMMERLLSRYFPVGPLFLPVMALLPLGGWRAPIGCPPPAASWWGCSAPVWPVWPLLTGWIGADGSGRCCLR